MEWVLRSPQIHNTFGNLGFLHPDGYLVNENCNAALETILHNILTEDKYLRTYRRCISFGQNIKKDLIPLLIHAKEENTIELLIRILVNLTIPVECLLSLDFIAKTDAGRHTVFEINNLLVSTKAAFTDNRATKVIIDFLKKNSEQKLKLSVEQCTNISNSLLLLRNILHIPEGNYSPNPNYNGPIHSVQNQILWNIFSQSIDKVLIKLMSISEAENWGVTMVQLIALLYKDQHLGTLHKLLNLWFEAPLSESSEDNESNTSPPDRGSEDSSPMLTSDPTSDSSDTGASGKSTDDPHSANNGWDASSMNHSSENDNQAFQPPLYTKTDTNMKKKNSIDNVSDDTMNTENDTSQIRSSSIQSEKSNQRQILNSENKNLISENSDCGYGTQIENQESISTSSNEDELPTKKPVHQKPHNAKQRINNKVRASITLQEKKRKKIAKRGKANIINVQGLSHKTPTDDDISNILKEFTVDFLLKGYNSLVQTLHNQILTNLQLEIDTSHFFWLVTYFLKFATQIKLDLVHVSSVLSVDIISYLTAEGVNLCEQFELAIKLDGNDLKPSMRRLHLVVTAIREFVQAIDVYKTSCHICSEDKQALVNLQIKICETEELRSLLILLLRHFNPKYHTKQYLQDLIVTNHILLIFLDDTMKLPEYNGTNNMIDHLKQFATPEIMYQYGLLLEDYLGNGEFVNDCIFTIMHHVGGELGCLISLFQPKILKTFTSIWKSEFEICDDWSDLIEYVINTFIKKPHVLQGPANLRLDTENFDDEKNVPEQHVTHLFKDDERETQRKTENRSESNSADRWTEEELSSLSWNYMQSNTFSDVIGEIVNLFKENSVIKSRDSIIHELFKQNLINKAEFESLSKRESKAAHVHKAIRDDEIGKLCDQLTQDGKSKFLDWVQKVLLETCFVKIHLQKQSRHIEVKIHNFELFKKKSDEFPLMCPVAYHSLYYNQSVPLVPWNCEQASICKDLKFLQLIHKLGFHMPVDTGKVFIRIPNFWTADFVYEVAGKVSPIDTSKLKFSLNDISDSSLANTNQENNFILPSDLTKDIAMISPPENVYQIHKEKHFATMINFTPMPGSSFSCEGGDEINKQNWLEVVQNSQDCKIIMNLGSSPVIKNNMEPDIAMRLPPKTIEVFVPPLLVPPPSPLPMPPLPMPLLVPPLMSPSAAHDNHLAMPTIMSVKLDNPTFNETHPEPEFYNNSAYETASVASDLTRMYVSDEDEKPEVLIPPSMEMMDDLSPFIDEEASCDSDKATVEKRPRVLSPTSVKSEAKFS